MRVNCIFAFLKLVIKKTWTIYVFNDMDICFQCPGYMFSMTWILNHVCILSYCYIVYIKYYPSEHYYPISIYQLYYIFNIIIIAYSAFVLCIVGYVGTLVKHFHVKNLHKKEPSSRNKLVRDFTCHKEEALQM